jgi:hypothetical protein
MFFRKKYYLVFLILTISFQLFSENVLNFIRDGVSGFGNWKADCTISSSLFNPEDEVNISAVLKLGNDYFKNVENSKIKIDEFAALVTAERTFDADGFMRFPSDERLSTLLTPAGLPIEGGVQGAVTKRYGFNYNTPIDLYQTVSVKSITKENDLNLIKFEFKTKLPDDLPPGIYRIRIDFGFLIKKRPVSLNNTAFAQRSSSKDKDCYSYLYSPVIPANGTHVSGKKIDALKIEKRMPWSILYDYNSNGYKGCVAEEDKKYYNLSTRNIIQDEVVLPLYNESGKKISYNLEPQFPGNSIDIFSNIPIDYTKGEIAISVTNPDGTIKDLGKFPVVDKLRFGVTTKKKEFTNWTPAMYGYYKAKVTGFIYDSDGNMYSGGGTYGFWIANRLTMATATFQGMSYPVGSRYGKDTVFIPGVPADVEINAFLYVNSDVNNVKSITSKGRATDFGLFGGAQGLKSFPLDAPGEYYAKILAKYTDKSGNLWVCSMTHAGIVYQEDSKIIAHGKKFLKNNNFYERGNTEFEGYVDESGDQKLAHVDFPYNSGDVLLMSAEYEGINKIEPVFTYETKGTEFTYEKKFSGIGRTNVTIKTSNGYSPHLFPEYTTSLEYYYGAAPRPGFMSRFLVGDDGVKAPYWPTTNTNFGGQFGASNNGDSAGDIYRLIGGVVVRKNGETPQYSGYISTAFIIPKGQKNNRVIEAGSEEITGPDGKKDRFFLVGLRPGSTYPVGAGIVASVQIDPILPVNMKVTLVYPNGKVKKVTGIGDKYGYFAGNERWILDTPGVYYYKVEGEWKGHKGYMPGLPKEGGQIYVFNPEDTGIDSNLKLDVGGLKYFPVNKGFTVKGSSTANEIYYSILMPGAVIEQGKIRVKKGKFEYNFIPAEINKKIPIYDIKNIKKDKDDIGRIVHMSFFSKEKSNDGKYNYELKKIILRGTKIISVE